VALSAGGGPITAAELIRAVAHITAPVAAVDKAAGGRRVTHALSRGFVQALSVKAEGCAAAATGAIVVTRAIDADLLAFVRVRVTDASATVVIYGASLALGLADCANAAGATLANNETVDIRAAVVFRNAMAAAPLLATPALCSRLAVTDPDRRQQAGETGTDQAEGGTTRQGRVREDTDETIEPLGIHSTPFAEHTASAGSAGPTSGVKGESNTDARR